MLMRTSPMFMLISWPALIIILMTMITVSVSNSSAHQVSLGPPSTRQLVPEHNDDLDLDLTLRRTRRGAWWSKRSQSGNRYAPFNILIPERSTNNGPIADADGRRNKADASSHKPSGDSRELELSMTCYSGRCVPRFIVCFAYATDDKLRVRCKLGLHICRLKCHQLSKKSIPE